MTYLIEYLGEFEFIFETILDYESGDQMGSFDAKNRHQKSHAWAPLMVASGSVRNGPDRYHWVSQTFAQSSFFVVQARRMVKIFGGFAKNP